VRTRKVEFMKISVGRVLRSRTAAAMVGATAVASLVGGIAFATGGPPSGGVIHACGKVGDEIDLSSSTWCKSGEGNPLSWNAAGSDGYFQAGSTYQTVPPNNVVATLDTKNVPSGSYLITARVDAQSYGPNSGAICFFTSPETPNGWGWTTLNTSSDWTNLNSQWTIMLNTYTGNGGTVTLSCQSGYTFTNTAQAKGTLMMVRVNTLS
jgi:hypothetical protein